MNRKITFVVLVSLFFTVPIFAQADLSAPELKMPQFNSVLYFAAAGEEDYSIPNSIRNNEFYLESLRLTRLAQETFEYGDYDTSSGFAEEAIRYAQLSNEYVASQLISEAKRLLDWADANNVASLYSSEYYESKKYYEVSVAAHFNEEWEDAIIAAIDSIEILAAIEAILTSLPSKTYLPSQYTVRPWASTKDCLWNIAGYPWVYGEPRRWRVLYDANKSKLPNPNNPNLIESGMVLDIPSISGEVRQGMWDSSKTYETR